MGNCKSGLLSWMITTGTKFRTQKETQKESEKLGMSVFFPGWSGNYITP